MDSDLSLLQPQAWTYNPWKEKPLATWAVFLIDCAIILVVYISYKGDQAIVLFLLLAAIVMFGMTLALLTPIGYKLDEAGVTVRFLGVKSFRPWSHYRNIYVHPNGVFLTSMRRPSGLDPFRGHFLHYRGSNREQIVSYARRHIQSKS